jgi:hypothetical protein
MPRWRLMQSSRQQGQPGGNSTSFAHECDRGDSRITVTAAGIAAESVAYDPNLACEILRNASTSLGALEPRDGPAIPQD